MQYRIQTNRQAQNGPILFERPVWCENRYTAIGEYRRAVSDAVKDSPSLSHAARHIALCDAEGAINASHLILEVGDYRVAFDVYP